MAVDHLHARPRDLSITSEHRTCLRDVVDNDDPKTGCDIAAELEAYGLLTFAGDRYDITDDGCALLAAHDRLAQTRRVERPRLEPRPLPERWEREPDVDGIPGRSFVREPYIVTPTPDGRILIHHIAVEDLSGELLAARDVVALLEWIQHSRAVEAQEV